MRPDSCRCCHSRAKRRPSRGEENSSSRSGGALLRHGGAEIVVADGTLLRLDLRGDVEVALFLLPPLAVAAALAAALHFQLEGVGRDACGRRGAGGVNFTLHRVRQLRKEVCRCGGVVDAALVAREVKARRKPRHAEVHARFAAAEQPLEGVGPLILDKVVRVLLDRLPVHDAVGKLEHAHGKIGVVEQLQRLLRGDASGVVVVVAENELLRVAREQADLLGRERRAHRGAGVVEARLMEHHHVDVALDKDDVLPLALLGEVQPVEHAALAVNDGLGRVHIFCARVVFIHDASAEGDHVAAYVDDGENKTLAEFVVHAAALALHDQSRGEQLGFGVALSGHRREQAVPLIGACAEPEVDRRPARDPPLVQVFRAGLAALIVQQLVVEACRVAVELQKPRAQAAALALLLLGNGQIRALGEKTHRVGEGQVLLLHDEADDAAALLAAEAVIDLLVRRDGERARLFVVKGA